MMNHRIKALSTQAGNYADIESAKAGYFYTIYTDKFVELLVKECGNFTDPITRNLLLKHFGIKNEQ